MNFDFFITFLSQWIPLHKNVVGEWKDVEEAMES